MDLDLGLDISRTGFADLAGQMQLPDALLQQINAHCAEQVGQEKQAVEEEEAATWGKVVSKKSVRLKKQEATFEKTKANNPKALNAKEAERAAKLAAAGVANGVSSDGVVSRG